MIYKFTGYALFSVAALAVTVLIPECAISEPSNQGSVVIPFQLKQTAQLNQKLTDSLRTVIEAYEGSLPKENAAKLGTFSDLVVASSSVEVSPRKKFVILYSMLADLFTVIKVDERGGYQSAYLINGAAANTLFGKGKVAEEKDIAVRFFKQRPALQREIGKILDSDEDAATAQLRSYQTDPVAARSVVLGLVMQIKNINDYRTAACREDVEKYRTSEAFALRFRAGKTDVEHLVPAAMLTIGEVSTFLFQDDQMARSFAFLEVSPSPECRIKQVRTFFSY